MIYLINKKKCIINLIVLGIIFQNFAIIKTEKFGISILVLAAILSHIYTYKNKKNNIELFLTLFLFFSLDFIKVLLEHNKFSLSILRGAMIIYISYTIKNFLSILNYFEIRKLLYKLKVLVNLLLCYGIYEFLSYYFKTNLFLNFLSNNPSYKVAGPKVHFGGWIAVPRISSLWFEPSAYASFLLIVLCMYYYVYKKYDIKIKKIEYIGIFLNILLTMARTGLVGLVLVCAFIILTIFIKKYTEHIITCIPFLILFLMYLGDKFIFKDLSSSARTTSPIFYLKYSLKEISIFLFGKGSGGITNVYSMLPEKIENLEGFTHNSYIQLIFEYGILIFGIIYFKITRLLKSNEELKKLFIPIFVTLGFASYYSVESYIILIILIIQSQKIIKSLKVIEY